jgi:hypothetical protein
MATTKYVTMEQVVIPGFGTDMGWGIFPPENTITLDVDQTIVVTTAQTSSVLVQDDGPLLTLMDGREVKVGFDNLGRLIACGAIRQTD